MSPAPAYVGMAEAAGIYPLRSVTYTLPSGQGFAKVEEMKKEESILCEPLPLYDEGMKTTSGRDVRLQYASQVSI